MMLNKYLMLLAALVLAGLLVSCGGDDDGGSDTEAPETYNFDDYDANIAPVAHLPANLSALATAMKAGRTPGTAVSANDLRGYYTDAGAGQSLSDITTGYYRGYVDTWINELASASEGADAGEFPIQPNGGAWNGYLFDENGAEIEQFIEKGLFEAAFYNQAAQLLSGTPDAQAIDQAFAFYGADPSFPNNSDDSFGAKYAARRDNGGYYTNLKENFLELRVAAIDGRDEDVQTRARTVLELWEEAMGATVVNYLYATIDKMSNPDATDADRASGLHAWGEAVGFLMGFTQTPTETRRITDDKIDELLVKMRANIVNGQPPAPTTLNTTTAIADLESVITELTQIYSFADPEIFRINDVSANGRDN